jgi:hypothetical protein
MIETEQAIERIKPLSQDHIARQIDKLLDVGDDLENN